MSDRSESPPTCGWWRSPGSIGSGRTSTKPCSPIGNGRLGTRGSLEEGHLGQLSGTFLAGVYDGHDVPVIDLVNAPDWVDTTVVVDGVRLDVDTCTVVSHHRALDLRDGLLTRTTVFEDAEGRRTRLDTVRCASMADRRICALRVEVTPENHAAEVRVETGIDGDRRNLERLPLYPEGTVFSSGDPLGEVGPGRASAGVGPITRGPTPSTWRCARSTPAWTSAYAAATACEPPPQRKSVLPAQRADHRGNRAPRRPGRDAAAGQACRYLRIA